MKNFHHLTAKPLHSRIQYAYGYLYIRNDRSGFGEALKLAARSDILILTLGGKHSTSSIASMGEGVDSADINLPVCQDDFIDCQPGTSPEVALQILTVCSIAEID